LISNHSFENKVIFKLILTVRSEAFTPLNPEGLTTNGVEFGSFLQKWLMVLKTSKWFYQTCIYISSCLILWGCASPVNVEVSPTPKPPEPIQEKLVNSLGGYFYSNGKNALGPFTQRMLQKCRDGNGGIDTPRSEETGILKNP